MKTSANGINLIKQFEGLELEAYQDAVGIWTIGYGHTGPDVKPGMRITEKEADNLLSKRLAREFEPGVNSAIRGDVNQNEFDALVSLAYNIGVSALKKSTVIKRLNKGDIMGAADAILWWNKAGGRVLNGLVRRRAAERALFLQPVNALPRPAKAPVEENTRAAAEESKPRRNNLGESRTIQGATVAGGAGVAGTLIGQNDSKKLHNLEQEMAEQNTGAATGAAPATQSQGGDAGAQGGGETTSAGDGGDGGTSSTASGGETQTAATGEQASGEQASGEQASGEQTSGAQSAASADNTQTGTLAEPENGLQKILHPQDVQSQIQLAILIVIVLGMLYTIYARLDDWARNRR